MQKLNRTICNDYAGGTLIANIRHLAKCPSLFSSKGINHTIFIYHAIVPSISAALPSPKGFGLLLEFLITPFLKKLGEKNYLKLCLEREETNIHCMTRPKNFKKISFITYTT